LDSSDRFHVFACARESDFDTLKRDLLRSPAILDNKVPLSVLWNQESASIAFKEAIGNAVADFLIFTHCDVYFPKRWFEKLEWELERLSRMDPDWAVAGICGLTPHGEMVGRMWDCSLEPLSRGVYGKALQVPVPIVSTDECAFILRRGANITFDPLLPNFHLYATDIILTAERMGMRSYGVDLPLIHNAKAQLRMGRDYIESYQYMVRKWRDRLPVPTTCGSITANPVVPLFRRFRIRYKAIFRPSTYNTIRIEDPAAKAIELGLDKMLEVQQPGTSQGDDCGGHRSCTTDES
jgi:hypothetical protein